jgi:integrase/recombinase XerD
MTAIIGYSSSPHALRHSWTTACVDARVPVDQIQHDGGWADPRLIPYYSHGADRPEKAATHGITAYVMGAA